MLYFSTDGPCKLSNTKFVIATEAKYMAATRFKGGKRQKTSV